MRYSYTSLYFLLFCIIFSLEPILKSWDVYWYLMLFLVLIGIIALICYILGIFRQRIAISETLVSIQKTSPLYMGVCILGIIISYIYKSTLFKSWLFLLAIELFVYCMNRFKRNK